MTPFTRGYALGCLTGFGLSFLFAVWFWNMLT